MPPLRRTAAIGVAILTLVVAAPSFAAETPARDTQRAPDSEHVAPELCDAIALDSAGDLLVEGEPTVPGALLTPAIHQALEANDSTTGGACIDVEFDGEVVQVNGHIETCGAVTGSRDDIFTPGSLVIGDVPIVIGGNSYIDQAALVAEVGGGEACLLVTVTEDVVVVEAHSSACVNVSQGESVGSIALLDGDSIWGGLLPTELIDPAGILVSGTFVETGLEVDAFWNQESGDTGSVITVVTLDNCDGPDTSTPPAELPDTAMQPPVNH